MLQRKHDDLADEEKEKDDDDDELFFRKRVNFLTDTAESEKFYHKYR